ncbi:hypothetical protein [Novipirellula sp.]|uniref:hypothetical protein n=1 Tax=Novipirellula sp. TaxID=2795430 RepID=UPI00356ADEA4
MDAAPPHDDQSKGTCTRLRALNVFEMEIDFYNVNAGEEFEHESKRYRKLDDRRAMLIDKTSGERRAIHFLPEDKVKELKRAR